MMRIERNSYSQHWFKFFHLGIDESRTTLEADFIQACAPLPSFRTVLDLCCGMGRHARALSGRGYLVTGIERDPLAIAQARELANGPSYFQADVRDYQPKKSAYDLAIVMSQSFGYFEPALNLDLLRRLRGGVRQGGRLILDLWNPDFFAAHQGKRDFELPGGIVRETKSFKEGRLSVNLVYPDGKQDDFEWQLFTLSERAALANPLGLALIISCTDFDCGVRPCASKPRIQFVLERRDA